MMEKKVLSAVLADREAFALLKDYLMPEDLSDQGQIIYRLAADYYKNDSHAGCVDVDILRSRIEREYPKHSELLATVVKNISSTS